MYVCSSVMIWNVSFFLKQLHSNVHASIKLREIVLSEEGSIKSQKRFIQKF